MEYAPIFREEHFQHANASRYYLQMLRFSGTRQNVENVRTYNDNSHSTDMQNSIKNIENQGNNIFYLNWSLDISNC